MPESNHAAIIIIIIITIIIISIILISIIIIIIIIIITTITMISVITTFTIVITVIITFQGSWPDCDRPAGQGAHTGQLSCLDLGFLTGGALNPEAHIGFRV